MVIKKNSIVTTLTTVDPCNVLGKSGEGEASSCITKKYKNLIIRQYVYYMLEIIGHNQVQE